MFAKLLKMEFRSTWNVLGILCMSLVGAGLLGGVAIRYLVGASAPKEWLEVLCTLAITAAVLFFVVCGVAALIVQIVRFYRSRFTDEGYLTFTLPVTTHQVLLSSFLTSAVNLIAVAAVAFYYILHVVDLTFTGVSMVKLAESPNSLLGLLALVNLIIAVAGYFLMYFLVDKKLNLN